MIMIYISTWMCPSMTIGWGYNRFIYNLIICCYPVVLYTFRHFGAPFDIQGGGVGPRWWDMEVLFEENQLNRTSWRVKTKEIS